MNDSVHAILRSHLIPTAHWGDFFNLIETGEVESPAFYRLIRTNLRYGTACREIMELLMRPFHHLLVDKPSSFQPLNKVEIYRC